jgi:endothelin-converting enzyme/putative endopeptidase
MDNVTRRDPKALNNVRSLAQLEESTPSFDWKAYLAAVGAPTPKHYLVSTPGFMTAMDELIRTSSLEDWKTYLRWWTLHGHAPLLSSAFVQENFDFFARTLSGSKKLLPRWRRCVNIADRDLGEALGAAYVERAFPPESKRRVDQLVSDLRASLATGIDGLDWMAPATKKAAQEKLGAILQKIGYPGTWRDYGTVKIDRASLVQNVRSATAFELRRQLAKVGKPPDRLEWTMTPPTVNAYYSSQFNTINFPAGMLQPPYFDATKDDAVNYGAIGMVIGHEILHGFDDSGRQFDATGTLRDWWTPADAKAYEQRSSCIVNQYTHDVPDLGVKTNGKLTQGEDIADNGGIRLALAGLDRALAKAGQSATSKGPDGLTARQRFFAGNAFAWCQNIRPEFARVIIRTNPHSLHEYRVNYVLANQPEFREAFGCSAGKPMSPAKACRVW